MRPSREFVRILLLAAVIALLAWCRSASAETQGLYLNFDNKQWTLVSWYVNEDECDKAARRAIREKLALGAGCRTFTPEREVKTWKPRPDDGYKSDRQRMIDERQQKYDNRRDRYEGQFYRATPGGR